MQRRLWNDVEALIREGGAGIERKNDAVVLTRLSLMDQGWLSMIPAERQEIYGALYDEATDKTETDMAKRRTEVYSAKIRSSMLRRRRKGRVSRLLYIRGCKCQR